MSNYVFSLKFILDKRNIKNGNQHPIYARIIVNRKKAEIALYLTADPRNFNLQTGRVIKPGRYENYLNNRLKGVEDSINTIRFNLEDEGIPVTAQAIKRRFQRGKENEGIRLLDFFELVIKEMEAKPEQYTPHVLRHYAQCRDKMRMYLETIQSKDIAIDKFSRKHIDGFEFWMATTVSKATGRKLCRNTMNTALKKLRSVFNHAIRKELILRNPFIGFKIIGVKSTRVALSYEEILAIANHPLGGNESLRKVRDIFLFSCFSGLRFGDAMSLKSEDVREDRSGRLWITIKQEKTEKIISIPMLAPVKTIYNRYEANRIITGFVLPSISNQKLNAYLKQIALMVGIRTNLTHHIGRYSYAVMLMDKGIDYKIISEMMGHYSIRSTETYGKVSQSLLAKTADKLEQDLL